MEVAMAAADALSVLNSVSVGFSFAEKGYPGRAKEFESHCGEISKAQRVVELIRGQEELLTLGVVAGIAMLQSHGEILKQDLKSLEQDKGERNFKPIVDMLRNGRKSLINQIRIASIGLAADDGGYYVDTKVVHSTNEAVEKALGEKLGLDIPRFLANLQRSPDAKGKMRLSQKEYEEWTLHQIKSCDPEIAASSTEVKTRITANCLARDQSLQILGPIGEDIWANIAFVKVENLVSMDNAIQFGYGQPLNVFEMAMKSREKMAASSHVKMINR